MGVGAGLRVGVGGYWDVVRGFLVGEVEVVEEMEGEEEGDSAEE